MPKKKPSPKHPQASADIPGHPETAAAAPRRRRVIALAGQKGGAGKTTTAIALAVEWHSRGARTLLVDTDPQASARTWADVAAELNVEAPTVVAMGAGLHQPTQLPALAAERDVTLVDCPPRLDALQRAVLMVANVVVLPCGPSTLDAWALAESLELVRQARELRPELLAAILITRKVPRTAVGKAARDVLVATGLPVLTTELCYRVAYQEAPAAGMGPTTYAANSPAADEVRALATELEAFA